MSQFAEKVPLTGRNSGILTYGILAFIWFGLRTQAQYESLPPPPPIPPLPAPPFPPSESCVEIEERND